MCWQRYTETIDARGINKYNSLTEEEEEAIQVYLRSVVGNGFLGPDVFHHRELYESRMESIATRIRMLYPNTGAGRSELDDFNRAWRAKRERTSNDFDKAEKKATQAFQEAEKKAIQAKKDKAREKKERRLAKEKAAAAAVLKSENMKKQLKRLKASGFPKYITVDYLSKNLEDKEYARLFKFLRSNGVPNQSENQYDILNDIDFYVFTGILSKEDGLFVINHSHHIELMQAKFSKKLKLNKKEAKENANYVKRLLVDEGFNEFPDSVKKVVNGGSIDAIAILDDIKRKKYSTIHDGRLQRIANIENISPKVDDESSSKNDEE